MKKLLILILILLLSMQITFTAGSSSASDDSQAAAFLTETGIFDEYITALSGDAFITRGQLAKIIVRALGFLEPASSVSIFSDVEGENQGYIKIAYELNLMNGFNDSSFKPNDNITSVDAVKVIVAALGYDAVAKNKGGYPTGYLLVAQQTGILKYTINLTDEITKNNLAQILFNALKTKMLSPSEIGEGIEYTTDEIWLTKMLSIYIGRGQINANFHTTLLSSDSGLLADQIKIENEKYYCGRTAADNFLGYFVDYYYKVDEITDNKILIFINPHNNQDEFLVQADEVLASGSTTGQLNYKRNDVVKSLKLSSAPYVIYNGKATSSFSAADFNIDSGEIRLLNTKSGSGYDIIFINSYELYVCDSVSDDGYTIYSKYGKPALEIEEPSNHNRIDIIRNSKKIPAANLTDGDILSVLISKDDKITCIYVSDERITGSITAVTEDDYLINEKEYKLSKKAFQTISINSEGTFYLDFKGEIVVFEEGENSDKRLGLLYKLNTGSKTLENPKGMIFTSDSEFQTFYFADRLEYNGTSGVSAKTAADSLNLALNATIDIDKPILIKYRLNKDNNISLIRTAADNTDYTGVEYDRNEFSLDYFNITGRYQHNLIATASKAYITGTQTPVFIIPFIQSGDVKQFLKEEFSASIVKQFFTESDVFSYIDFYNLDEEHIPEAIVIAESAGTVNLSADSEVALVTKTASVVDDDGEPRQRLHYLYEGELTSGIINEKTVIVSKDAPSLYSDITVGQIKVGDVIQLRKINGIIERIRPIYIAGSMTDGEIQNSAGGSVESRGIETYYGSILKKTNTLIMFDIGSRIVTYPKNSARVYIVKQDKSVKVGNFGDIVPASQSSGDSNKVFVRISRKVLKNVILYE